MTSAELKARLLRIIGINQAGSASAYQIDSVVHAINHAYQVLWQDVPKERRAAYTRRPETVTVSVGNTSVELDPLIASVLPPVRRLPDRVPLSPCSHRSEIECYGLLTGRKVTDALSGPPQVYFLESRHQAMADSLRLTLYLAPAPASDTEIVMDVEIHAPSITASNLCSASPVALQIPNDYAESLLYPIAAYHLATVSTEFRQPEKLPAIEAEYERAKARLGITDPAVVAAKTVVKPADR